MMHYILWGTGSRARSIMEHTLPENIEITAFIDNDPARRGTFFDRPVFGPEALADLDYDRLAIASTFYEEIREQACRLGVDEARITTPGALYFLCHNKGLDPETFECLCSVPFWYHRFEIRPGLMTPGICNYKTHLLDHPELADVADRRVLDIGAWDGPYTLEMSRRGAQVTAYDIQPPDNSAFNITCRLNDLHAAHICANVYDLAPERHGTFDIVLFFGVYYHLKNPLQAFENIHAVLPMGGLMAFEGAILEGAPCVDAAWRNRADLIQAMGEIPYAHYVKDTYQDDWSNWWIPNMPCLRQWIESCGFEILRMDMAEKNTRGYGLARKVREIGQEHTVLSGAAR